MNKKLRTYAFTLAIAGLSLGATSRAVHPQQSVTTSQAPQAAEGNGHLSVTLETPGTLGTYIDEDSKYTITSLKVIGGINGDDVKLIRDMAGMSENDASTEGKLTVVDLSEANIVAGGAVYASYRDPYTYMSVEATTEKDVFPQHFFTVGKYNSCKVKEVLLPNTITKIGDYAFMNADSLKTLTIPEKVTCIGTSAFDNGGLTELAMPNSITEVQQRAFFGCTNLTSVTLSENIKELPLGLFQNSALKDIVIPDGVETIGSSAFNGCRELVSVTGGDNVKTISPHAFNNCVMLENMEILKNVESIGHLSISNNKKLTSLQLPATLKELKTDNSSGHPFVNDEALTSITIDNLNEHYYSANEIVYSKGEDKKAICYPSGAKAAGIVIDEGTKEISPYAFAACPNIKVVSLPSSLEKIGAGAFNDDKNITEIICNATVPPTFQGTGYNPFQNVKVKNCTLSVPSGSEEAYAESSLWKDFNIATIGNEITLTEPGTLNCKINSVQRDTITNLKIKGDINGTDVKLIRYMAGVSESDTETPGKLTCIDLSEANIVEGGEAYAKYIDPFTYNATEARTENNVFPVHFFNAGRKYGCSVKTVILPASITKIGNQAFMNTASLKDITFPENVTSIGEHAFYGSGLTHLEMPDNITEIQTGSFHGCANMKTARLSNAISSLPTSAFQMSGLQEIEIPDNISIIGGNAFASCKSLTRITGGKGVKEIYPSAFTNCEALEEIDILDNIEKIGNRAITFTTRLKELHLPASLKELTVSNIEGHPFVGNIGMTSLSVDEANENYYSADNIIYTKGDDKKAVCCPSGISPENNKLVIENGVKEICPYAFSYCANITEVELPSSLETLGAGAFSTSPYISKITSLAPVPPAFNGFGSDPFSGIDKANCTLTVPEGSKTEYEKSELWNGFNIQETLGVAQIVCEKQETGRYDLCGRKVNGTTNGIIIVKYNDGTTEKKVVR